MSSSEAAISRRSFVVGGWFCATVAQFIVAGTEVAGATLRAAWTGESRPHTFKAGLQRHFCNENDNDILKLDMGMPSLFRKVFLVDLLQGLKVTFRYQDPKEIYTEQYPLQRPQVAERYRGAPRLNVNPDTNETMCIACDLCALACPEHLIVVSAERNEKTRRKELTTFTYDLSRCMFCGLCEDACPTDALELTQDFELANYTREGAIWDRETLEKGPQPTQYRK